MKIEERKRPRNSEEKKNVEGYVNKAFAKQESFRRGVTLAVSEILKLILNLIRPQ